MMDQKERNIWWGPPRKFNEKIKERKISWLELFYDLVYVAAISQLTQYLAEHPTWEGLGYFFFIFTLILWSWLNGTFYHDAHGSTGIRTRYFTLLQMLVVAAVTITLPELFEGHHQNFAIAFSCVQALITYLWWSVGYYDHSHRRLNFYYLIFYSLALAIFIISVYTNYTVAQYLWITAILLNYAVPVIAGPNTVKELRSRGIEYVTSSSIIERFGLFTIIVLGENILGIVHGIAHIHDKSMSVWFIFMLAILIAFLLWWVYFDMTGDSEAKPGYKYFLYLNLVNVPLLAAFAAAGSCIRVILANTQVHVDSDAKWIFGLSLTIILFGIYLITKLMQQEEAEEKVMKKLSNMVLATAFSVLLLTTFNKWMDVQLYLGLITLILGLPVYVGSRIWVRYKIFAENLESEEIA